MWYYKTILLIVITALVLWPDLFCMDSVLASVGVLGFPYSINGEW